MLKFKILNSKLTNLRCQKERKLTNEKINKYIQFFVLMDFDCINFVGITMTDGFLWHEQRTFAMKHLQNLGFGKEIMEKLMQEEIQVIEIYFF